MADHSNKSVAEGLGGPRRSPESLNKKGHGADNDYETLVRTSPQGSIYCHRWWLEAVAPEEYRILEIRRGDRSSSSDRAPQSAAGDSQSQIRTGETDTVKPHGRSNGFDGEPLVEEMVEPMVL